MIVPDVVLIHGAATTSSVYEQAARHLSTWAHVFVPQRRYCGDMTTELHDLETVCRGSIVVGVSGGATLALALYLSGLPMTAVIAHEPAVGSWAPGLLHEVQEAFEAHGVAGFGAALYGQDWTIQMSPDEGCVRRDLAMFISFQPETRHHATPLYVTVGQRSPVARHDVARTLVQRLGAQCLVIREASHAVHLQAPAALAATVRQVWDEVVATDTRREPLA